jgi:hypothetical protein
VIILSSLDLQYFYLVDWPTLGYAGIFLIDMSHILLKKLNFKKFAFI